MIIIMYMSWQKVNWHEFFIFHSSMEYFKKVNFVRQIRELWDLNLEVFVLINYATIQSQILAFDNKINVWYSDIFIVKNLTCHTGVKFNPELNK